MEVVLFGASGMIGSRILRELVSRGHQVTAVVRNPSRVEPHPQVKTVAGDQTDVADVVRLVKGADAVITAYSPGVGTETEILDATRWLIAGTKQAGVKRLIMVGGAGSLEVAPGVQLVDTPQFPTGWKAIALAHRDTLPILRRSDLDWTNLSPAAEIQPGERTGKFRRGANTLLVDGQGHSRISAEDYAIAIVDELEHPAHVRQRFTVAY